MATFIARQTGRRLWTIVLITVVLIVGWLLLSQVREGLTSLLDELGVANICR